MTHHSTGPIRPRVLPPFILLALLAACGSPGSIPLREAQTPPPVVATASGEAAQASFPAPAWTLAATPLPAPAEMAAATVPPVPIAVATGAASQAPALTSAAVTYWPTQDWRASTPAEQAMDAGKLSQALDAIREQNLNLYSLLVIRNGYIVSETYFGSNLPTDRPELYSVTKSFIATLVGIAIDKGLIGGVDRPVGDFFPDRKFAHWDAAKQAMTLENLLTMTTGLGWPEADETFRKLYGSRDWVKFVLDERMRSQPGSEFLYCSGCSHVLSAIVQRQTGMNTREFAQQVLFEPLGIRGVAWDTDSTGIPIGGWGLKLTPRDMAKLGYLYLNGGRWEGRQIVSEEWVKTATQKHTASDTELGYGYQWWTYPKWGAYAALGRYGQTIFVIPEMNLIVVTTAALANHDPIFKLIEDYIVPAVMLS
jgi:CubicO group peptidase (beta-lactamase class C family)